MVLTLQNCNAEQFSHQISTQRAHHNQHNLRCSGKHANATVPKKCRPTQSLSMKEVLKQGERGGGGGQQYNVQKQWNNTAT